MALVTPEVRSRVSALRPEAPHSVTIRLDLDGSPFAYRPGQYIEIDPHQFGALGGKIAELEEAKGMPEPPRSFSLSSDALDPGFVEISVKENPMEGKFPPLLTSFLVTGLKEGDPVVFRGPGGRYFLPEAPPPGITGFLHICAGSGVAPNRGMIRHALGRAWPQRHVLVLQNRRAEDVFFKEEWRDLLARHPEHLRIRHVFSVEAAEHVSPDILRQAMEGWIDPAASMALVCGPNRPRVGKAADGTTLREPGFCEKWCGNPRRKAAGMLEPLGFAAERILTEMW